MIRKFQPLCLCQQVRRKLVRLQFHLHLNQDGKLIDKPAVYLRDVMDEFRFHRTPDGLRDPPDPHIIHDLQFFQKHIVCEICEIIGHQAVHVLFQRPDRFHQGRPRSCCRYS